MKRRALIAALCLLATAALAQAPDRDQALIAAAGRGDTAASLRLLKEGASLLTRDTAGRTALVAAAYGNHIETARVLLEAGASPNVRDTIGRTAFMVAAVYGHLELLRLTLKHGADIHTINQYGGTALIPASHYGHVEVVRELLKTAINVNHVNRLGWTALIEAVILGDGGARHTEIVRLLLAHGADPNIADRDRVTPAGLRRDHPPARKSRRALKRRQPDQPAPCLPMFQPSLARCLSPTSTGSSSSGVAIESFQRLRKPNIATQPTISTI
ncbi:MAG: ankyrin repeat domain-containing protein [Burkholderiales bacterium]|nr:ankyrin repeat domain-containing protein [Burkholderiales bacterium]